MTRSPISRNSAEHWITALAYVYVALGAGCWIGALFSAFWLLGTELWRGSWLSFALTFSAQGSAYWFGAGALFTASAFLLWIRWDVSGWLLGISLLFDVAQVALALVLAIASAYAERLRREAEGAQC